MSALSVAGASWRLSAAERAFLATSYLPWALEAGSRCADLMSLYYERHWHVSPLLPQQRPPAAGAATVAPAHSLEVQEDLATLRRQWRVTLAPQRPRAPRERVLLQAVQQPGIAA